MNYNLLLNSILLGIGLAMDAFSVSVANALNETKMKPSKMCGTAFIFGGFQTLMPLIGWICIHTIVEKITIFEAFIPWIALVLLGYIGGKMLLEGIQNKENDEDCAIGFKGLMIQGIATSIDALSVGFTIADYNLFNATVSAIIIGIVTFFICIAGLKIGKTIGNKLSNKASILGGIILIGIGLKIFITSIL